MKPIEEIHILLAEDNLINQRIAALTFNQMGLVCDIASNGLMALELAQKKEYDLILMDMQMPVMDGLESARNIRTYEKDENRYQKAIIVALSANEMNEQKQKCLDAGMDDFIEKPLQIDKLNLLISKHII